jgi:hypothetical protein
VFGWFNESSGLMAGDYMNRMGRSSRLTVATMAAETCSGLAVLGNEARRGEGS